MVRKERRREVPNPMIQKVRGVGGTREGPLGSLRVPGGPGVLPALTPLSPRPPDQAVYEGEAGVRSQQQRGRGSLQGDRRHLQIHQVGGKDGARQWSREALRMWDQLLISYSCFLATDALLCPFSLHTLRARFILLLPPALLAGHRRLVVLSQRWELNLPNVTQSFQEMEHLNQVYLIVRFMFTALEQLPGQGIQVT